MRWAHFAPVGRRKEREEEEENDRECVGGGAAWVWGSEGGGLLSLGPSGSQRAHTPGFPELLVVYTCLKVGLVEQRPRETMHSQRLSAEGAALAGGHGESGYWGLLASAPFSRCLPRFHSLCESDGS